MLPSWLQLLLLSIWRRSHDPEIIVTCTLMLDTAAQNAHRTVPSHCSCTCPPPLIDGLLRSQLLRTFETKITTENTALDRGRTDRSSLTYDLDLQPLQAMVMTYSHAKVQCKRSVGYED